MMHYLFTLYYIDELILTVVIQQNFQMIGRFLIIQAAESELIILYTDLLP